MLTATVTHKATSFELQISIYSCIVVIATRRIRFQLVARNGQLFMEVLSVVFMRTLSCKISGKI